MREHSAADDTRLDRLGSTMPQSPRLGACRYRHVPSSDPVQPDSPAIVKAKRNPAIRLTARGDKVLFMWRFMADVLSHRAISFTQEGCASPPIIGLRRQVGVKAASQSSPSVAIGLVVGRASYGASTTAAGPASATVQDAKVARGTRHRKRG